MKRFMNQKVLKTALVCVISTLYTGASCASLYVGVDILKTNYSTQPRFGSNVFAKKPLVINAFLGYQLPKDFFVEGGYEASKSKGRSATIFEGDYYPGADAPLSIPGQFQTLKTKIRMEHPYLGVGFNYFFTNSGTSVSILAGMSQSRVKASLDVIEDDLGVLPPADAAAEHRTFNKKKIVPMLRLGLNQELSDNLAIRLTGTWRKLNQFSINAQQAFENPAPVIKFKNGVSMGVGMFYSF